MEFLDLPTCPTARPFPQVQYSALSHRGAVHLDLAGGAGAGVAAGAESGSKTVTWIRFLQMVFFGLSSQISWKHDGLNVPGGMFEDGKRLELTFTRADLEGLLWEDDHQG